MQRKLFLLVLLFSISSQLFSQTDTSEAKFVLNSEKFEKTVTKYLYYPNYASENGIQGKVVLGFRINKNGCIDSIAVMESPDKSLSEVAISALNRIKCDWIAGKHKGQPVSTWHTYSTNFSLPNGGKIPGLYRTLDEAVNNPEDVKILNLSKKDLVNIPSEIYSFSNMTSLRLEKNVLTEIPSEIINCTNLSKLLLSGNKINNIHPESTGLKKLSELDLSYNELSNVPSEVFNFKKLFRLYLTDNNLKSIPSEIENLKKLRYLYLSNNELDKLPEELLNMTKLYLIDLTGNNFSETEKELIKSKLPDTKVIF